MSDADANVLISIHQKHAARIKSGEKLVELRRRNLRVSTGTRLWIYSTAPIASIELTATVKSVNVGSPSEIWSRFGSLAAVSRDEFDNYFRGSAVAVAVVLSAVRKLHRPISLGEIRRVSRNFHPPRFTKHLPPHSAELNLLLSNLIVRHDDL